MKTKRNNRGATLIEFSLVLIMFLMVVFGITDFSRMLYTWNAATEATRAGARYAVACDDKAHAAAVLQRMKALMPELSDESKLTMSWVPAGCTHETCEGLTVQLSNVTYQWISPIAGVAKAAPITLPPFSTHLTREVMRQDPKSAEFCS